MNRPKWEKMLVLAGAFTVSISRWVLVACEVRWWWRDRTVVRRRNNAILQREVPETDGGDGRRGITDGT